MLQPQLNQHALNSTSKLLIYWVYFFLLEALLVIFVQKAGHIYVLLAAMSVIGLYPPSLRQKSGTRHPYKPIPRPIEHLVLKKYWKMDQSKLNNCRSSQPINMNIQETLLHAGSTKVNPYFTPGELAWLIQTGIPVSSLLMRDLNANGVFSSNIPIFNGRQVTSHSVRRPPGSTSLGSRFTNSFRIYPEKTNKTMPKELESAFPRVHKQKIEQTNFAKLQAKKNSIIATLAKRRETYQPKESVNSRSIPAQPLFRLPKLPAECEAVFQQGLKGIVPLKTNLTTADLGTLRPGEWLNGDAINASLGLLTARSNQPVPDQPGMTYPNVFAFATYFFQMFIEQGYDKVARQAKKKKIFSKDLLLVPVHLGNHWVLVSVDFRHKLITYFDSLGGSSRATDAVVSFLEQAHMDIFNQPFPIESWRVEYHPAIPEQRNGYDCGMFCIMFSKSLASPFYPPDVSSQFPFSQDEMFLLRLIVGYEVITGALLHN